MRHLLRSLVLSSAIAGVCASFTTTIQAQPAPAQAQAENAKNMKPSPTDVPVKAVVLFSSGVGYFEHFGSVTGDGITELHFKTNQINDILKSLILQDLDGGKVSNVTYPSQDPIGKTLKSFQVDITNNPPLADLLNQLRGAKVTLGVAPDQKFEGTVLGAEKRMLLILPGSPPVESWIVNLLDGATIRQIELNKVSQVKLEDAQLQEELTKALAALASARDQDKKPVQINFNGQGERRVRLGYVVETPVWKTSYRLILPVDPKEQAGLQGWAIVENQTDNDWNNVQLSLISGRPISFVQDLYQPLYIPRPVVVPEMFASLMPQTYEGAMADKKDVARFGMAKAQVGQSLARRAQLAPTAAAAPALQEMASGGAGGADSDQPINATASIASVASAAKVGELFQYTVGNVSLPRQKSAMLPIVTDPIEVERLSIYNAAVLPKNPLNGARVKNTTGKHLLQGPITVLDANTYAGDARIDNLPPGQERLLSYGIDLQLTVDSTSNKQESAVQSGKIVKGVMIVQRKYVATQDYLADNKSDKDKTLIVEHPRRTGGWKLIDTDKPIETTDAMYRFKGAVPAGKASKLTIKEELVQDEQFAILNADLGVLDMYRRTGEIPQPVRDVLIKAMTMRNAVVDTQRQIAEHDQRVTAITEEQNRIRENMRTVDRQSAYYGRLMAKLNDQESQLEKLQTERDNLRQKQDAQQKELEDFLNNTSVG